MRCPRCSRLWPLTYRDPIGDCRLCFDASIQFTKDGIAREEAAPPALPDAKGQSLLPGTEGIAEPVKGPRAKAQPPAPRFLFG